ncbi:MAG: thioredoxin domain-containing protein [Desulfobacteraceae bacterium]|nr:thioredoxin domain-containing protein [Desulfobacteraceae bacterium]MBC2756905.1 thioredoxin domain-containing protein [Desulfobacteraceae bacterium]
MGKLNKQVLPLAYPFYYIPVVCIALIGLFDSFYLAISHYRNYVDMGYQSFCAISRSLNCDTVSQSPYSIFLGVPVPIWGLLGYGFFLFLLIFSWHPLAGKKRVWTLMLLISLGFSIYSVILAFMSSYLIHSYCIMCILSHAVNLGLLFYSWIIRKRFACESLFIAIKLDVFYLLRFPKISIPAFSAFAVSALMMMLAFPTYWLMAPPVLSKNTPTGITEDAHPWIGAENPELEIVEFSDYRCFQCTKMHYFLRRLIEKHPDKIRLIHRHFPMDHTINPLVKEPFHTGAAKLSMLAIFATEKSKFWEMNDYLFNISRDIEALNTRNIAEHTNLDVEEMRYIFQDRRLWNVLWKDIKEGIRIHQLSGTPGFIINGQTHLGQIPADVLKPYLK